MRGAALYKKPRVVHRAAVTGVAATATTTEPLLRTLSQVVESAQLGLRVVEVLGLGLGLGSGSGSGLGLGPASHAYACTGMHMHMHELAMHVHGVGVCAHTASTLRTMGHATHLSRLAVIHEVWHLG